MNKLYISVSILLISLGSFAQKSTKEIKGDKYYSYYSFDKAIEKYTQADNLSLEGMRKLAESYRNTNNTIKAEETYSKYISQQGVIPDDFYNYASVLKENGKYDLAKDWMERFADIAPNDLRAKNYAANNAQLSNLLKDEGRYKISHLDINTDQEDFGTSYYNNKVVFASTRSGVKSIKRSYNWNQKPFLDLYVADVNGDQLKDPKNLNKKINHKLHEGPASFANDGTTMAFTRNNYAGKSTDGVVKLQIFFSTFKDGKWSEETPFKLNSSEYSVGHPSLTADGNTMYFVSDMPGGFGGADLYVIKKDASGVWGTAKNLGDKINTEGNEMFPYFEESNEFLFFASNGHLGLGGLDLFITPVKEDGTFGKVLNMGAPLNTQYDDFSLIIDNKMNKGYFSSNRTGGSGDDDIYAFQLLTPFSFGKTIKGIAKDKSGAILSGSTVKLVDDTGKEAGSATTGADGAYSFTAEADKKYKLTGTKDKYFDGANTASTAVPDDVITADVVLEKDPGLSLYAIVTDKATKQPLQGVKMKLINNVTGKDELINTPATGDFRKPLAENKLTDRISYNIVLEKDGYLSKTVTYNKVLDKEGQYTISQDMDLSMDKIDVGADLAKLINIKPIYFDLGKYAIRKDAAVELEKIVKVMNENPTMIVELGSHTDCRGTIAANFKLSDNRAKASAEYIKKKITNPERINGKGYGESKLKNGCACEGAVKSTCTEAEHQENRRTEFIIIKM
ncbi:MAG: OmpA/MotB domain protein [Bacteroidetes bacterium]|nr:OmpA/MotB domain protein [Bacteroidota bacterium]